MRDFPAGSVVANAASKVLSLAEIYVKEKIPGPLRDVMKTLS